ncbi:J domain-containing protein [Horticoccus luteus]|uniref:J domain-containing protein n=1 Tax=Horticoccus luteus TaxID=2862869 RepID=A0A8F9TTU2_9BACT|nr:J domain-containing protein [Horticoccus luteus]QYM78005.1 J domain-containing protein [Horticoccus luteus]
MAVKFKDYYETLDIPRTASPDEIKQAFRKLARIHHPDVAKNKSAGEAKFKEINEAYEVLSDPEKRRRYDELGARWQDPTPESPPPGYRPPTGGGVPPDESDFEFGGTGYSDFFESFFAGGRDGSGFSRRSAPGGRGGGFAFPGSDVEADILVTLEEVLRGSPRTITLRRPAMRGEPERTNTYHVRIPPGVREGQRIRLAGQGEPGQGGAAAGDLYLRVRLARHPDLSVRDADLYYDLVLAPWEAVLGAHPKIPTLDGATSLRVPPGTAAGSRLRLRGLGLPRGDDGRGDLYATVTLQTPPVVSAEEKALWEKLAAVSTFNPRPLS